MWPADYQRQRAKLFPLLLSQAAIFAYYEAVLVLTALTIILNAACYNSFFSLTYLWLFYKAQSYRFFV
jgi:hypothetical protein